MNIQILPSIDTKQDRINLEKKRGIIVSDIEYGTDPDKPKYLSSGLNSVMARLAAKNGNFIGINLKRLKNKNKADKAKLLARVRQNIITCREAGTGIAVLGALDKLEAKDFLLSLGASTAQANKSISF
jgi:RNase P/RNase MRP subunit p30